MNFTQNQSATANAPTPVIQPKKPQQGSTKLVIIAIIIALCVTVLNFLYIQSQLSKSEKNSVVFYRYKHNIKAGKIIRENDIEICKLSDTYRNSLPEAYIDEFNKTDSLDVITNKPLMRDVYENRIVFFADFTESSYDRIDKKISMGKRLIALPVNYKTLPGILRPGMFVDIEAPFMQPRSMMTKVMPVMERVKVIAVGKQSLSDEMVASSRNARIGNYSTISIEVTPEQATQLSSIAKITAGDFEIHLRYPSDNERPKLLDIGINPDVMELIGRTTNGQR
ncbi:hypothetical protein KS4_20980 [Poriferisphaera corsica]|uniref:Flp pilus assembly protein RcpC/CpaB domain-containing protein n=1 Tax=Poriferisphaera corsica TaxID=2528020 RepID=A0A517YUZ7_9BACT|nr:RcpC/CpaB family pilus assembly protein [Poriferisphaera corsica]QDU34036.1 hypothetical protein KS4_20980 [Poriferisphaera corsica]